MSWDVILTKNKEQLNDVSFERNQTSAAYDVDEVVSVLKGTFDDIQHDGDRWLTYEGDLFEISFNLGDDEIMLHIHVLDEPEDAVIATISELCKLFDSQAFDTAAGDFLKV